jgi:hypothetical protein
MKRKSLHGDGNIFYIVELIKSSRYNLILFFPQVKQATISSVLSNEPASLYYQGTEKRRWLQT